ncbi:hypothetical protein KSF_055410 [Reticulibacter mediterranei]|uniref:TIR domain-containing protein n=1 Tax=Reticulibacter mediterranei TaxID=2778369 RepID=A0A8J3IKJ4_9CHLR|nr:toll/interleukin-1 receptor domain-containing protein [Reticulibacter mediterranei]GHO95493.1 hypothetical protein KSF_055410 [Reticulibacter mediterranei]
MAQTVRDQVFISYSRKDKVWLDRLYDMLAPLLRAGQIKIWDDTHIVPGTRWYEEITDAISSAKVAVLLVSANFLASDFIAKHELTPILEAAKKEHVTILWIAVGHCLYQYTELKDYQAVNNPAKPLGSLSSSMRNKELTRICKEIIKHI